MKVTKRQLRRIIKEEQDKQKEIDRHFANSLQDDLDALKKPHSGNLEDVAAAQTEIENILNSLWNGGVENDGLIALLNNIIRDINAGFVGEPT